ncbi:hypothetical protein Tco_1268604 [Tanacetum coccineum]
MDTSLFTVKAIRACDLSSHLQVFSCIKSQIIRFMARMTGIFISKDRSSQCRCFGSGSGIRHYNFLSCGFWLCLLERLLLRGGRDLKKLVHFGLHSEHEHRGIMLMEFWKPIYLISKLSLDEIVMTSKLLFQTLFAFFSSYAILTKPCLMAARSLWHHPRPWKRLSDLLKQPISSSV